MNWIKRLFGWKNRQYETITQVQVGALQFRIWSTVASLEEAIVFDHTALATKITDIATRRDDRKLMLAAMMRLPKTACVAVVDPQGNGGSFYADWH